MVELVTGRRSVEFVSYRSPGGYRVRPPASGLFSSMDPNEQKLRSREGAALRIMPERTESLEMCSPLADARMNKVNIVAEFLNTPATEAGVCDFSSRYGPLLTLWDWRPTGSRDEIEAALLGEPFQAWLDFQQWLRSTVTDPSGEAIQGVTERRDRMGLDLQLQRDPETGALTFIIVPRSLLNGILLEMVFLLEQGARIRKCAVEECPTILVVGGGTDRGAYANKTTCSTRCRAIVSRRRRKNNGAQPATSE